MAICGELPELSETIAERSTGVPLLSAAKSNSGEAPALELTSRVYVYMSV